MAPNQTRGGKQQHKFEASDTTTNMPRGKSDAPKLTGERVLKLMDLYCTGKVGKGGRGNLDGIALGMKTAGVVEHVIKYAHMTAYLKTPLGGIGQEKMEMW